MCNLKKAKFRHREVARNWGQGKWGVSLDQRVQIFSYKMFTGRTDAEAEAPVLWPPDAKS